MTTQNYKKLGANDQMRLRRYKVLQLYLRGATPPEIAHTLGMEPKAVYNDIEFLRTCQLNDMALDIIRDMGANFYEVKVRELSARISSIPAEDVRKNYSYILGLEKLIQKYKEESLKIQGAYLGTEDPETPQEIKIIFETVTGRTKPALQEATPNATRISAQESDPDADQDPTQEWVTSWTADET
jgi:hypothetical protein